MASSIGDLQVDLRLASAKFEQGLRSVNQKLGGFESSLSLAKGALAGFLSLQTARQVLEIADGFNQMQSRIKSATGSVQEYAFASSRLFEISQATATELSGNVALFQRLKIGAAELGRTDQDVLRLAESINKLGIIGGATQSELGNASTQLAQALAGGVVRAEEFNSIVENTPMLAKAIADGLNVSVGELRKMVLDGKLLADDVFASILSQTADIDKQFNGLGSTIAQAVQRATTSMETFIGQLDQATGFSQSIAKWINEWAKEVSIVSAQMRRSAIYDQAEVINDIEEQYASLNSQIERTRQLSASMPGNEILKATLADEEKRLAVIKAQLDAERQKLDVLTNQDLLTKSSLDRLGIPAPEGAQNTLAPKPPRAPGSGGSDPKADLKEREAALKRLLKAEDEYNAMRAAAQTEIDSVAFGLQSERERIESEYQARMLAISEAKALELESKIAFDELEIRAAMDRESQITEIERQAAEARMELAEQERQVKLGAMQSLFGGLSALMNTGSKRLFAIGKTAAIAKATIDGYTAIQSALANVPYPFNIAAAAGMAVQTAANIASIKSQQFGGGGTISAAGGSPNVYRPSQPTIPNTTPGQGETITPTSREKITIINQTTGRVDRVTETQISPTERALLLEEAEDRVAASMLNPNSRVSRNMSAATTATRVR